MKIHTTEPFMLPQHHLQIPTLITQPIIRPMTIESGSENPLVYLPVPSPHHCRLGRLSSFALSTFNVPKRMNTGRRGQTYLARKAVDERWKKDGRKRGRTTGVCEGRKATTRGYGVWCHISVGGSIVDGGGGERGRVHVYSIF